MATVDQIVEQQFSKGRIFFSYCRICWQQSWNDYYGCEACKDCILFLLESVIERKCYACLREGECVVYFYCRDECNYCRLEKCYTKGMEPMRIGKHANGYYIKDIEPFLKKAVTQEPFGYMAINELKKIKHFFNSMKNNFENWFHNYPPSKSIKMKMREKSVKEKWEINGLIMEIAEESLLIHDVIKIDNSYYDPYKCNISPLQYLTIQILILIRRLRDFFPQGIIDVKTKNNLIYFSGPNKGPITSPIVLHQQLAIVANWMQVCFRYMNDLLMSNDDDENLWL